MHIRTLTPQENYALALVATTLSKNSDEDQLCKFVIAEANLLDSHASVGWIQIDYLTLENFVPRAQGVLYPAGNVESQSGFAATYRPDTCTWECESNYMTAHVLSHPYVLKVLQSWLKLMAEKGASGATYVARGVKVYYTEIPGAL